MQEEVEEYEEELTAAEVLHKLEETWLNEKHAPELLEPRMEIVECMQEQVNLPIIGIVASVFVLWKFLKRLD